MISACLDVSSVFLVPEFTVQQLSTLKQKKEDCLKKIRELGAVSVEKAKECVRAFVAKRFLILLLVRFPHCCFQFLVKGARLRVLSCLFGCFDLIACSCLV